MLVIGKYRVRKFDSLCFVVEHEDFIKAKKEGKEDRNEWVIKWYYSSFKSAVKGAADKYFGDNNGFEDLDIRLAKLMKTIGELK